MPGPNWRNERCRARARELSLLLVALAAASCRQGRDDRVVTGSPGPMPRGDAAATVVEGPAATDGLAVEAHLSFRGWRGEDPILRQETLFPEGALVTSYLVMEADGVCTEFAAASVSPEEPGALPAEPAGLRPGRILFEDGELREPGTRLAVAAQPDAGSPDLCVVELQLGGDETVRLERRWEVGCALAPTLGESGPEYEPVGLEHASISPTGGRLLVGLRGGGLPRYLLLDLREGGGGAFIAR